MVFRFEIDGCYFGEFSHREAIHDWLIREGYIQTRKDSDVYLIRVNGITTGSGEVVPTPKFLDASHLPKA